jgi:Transposase and inactivated derivatives
MQRLIDSLKQTVPDGIDEIQTLARTLTERATDILSYFATLTPAEAINGCLEQVRGIALGFRNLTDYTIRSLIHAGRLKDHLIATT